MKKITMFLLLYTAGSSAFAQNLSIVRVGHDEILVGNGNDHSISVHIGESNRLVLPAGSAVRQNFKLSTYQVHNTPFKVLYDNDSYNLDMRLCGDAAYRQQLRAQRNALAFYAIGNYLKGEITLGEVLIVLFANGFIAGVSGDEKRQIEFTLKSIYDSNASYEEKERRVKEYLGNFLERQQKIIAANQTVCEQRAQSRLSNTLAVTTYASEFIDVLEKSHFEFSPFLTAGFRVHKFQGEGSKASIMRSSFESQPSYGLRLAFNKSAYDKHKSRKAGMRYYFPVTYLHTRAVYKQNGTKAFPADTALSWDIVSAGFGWEFQKVFTKRDVTLASFQVDVGIASSVFNKHFYADSKLQKADVVSTFNGYSPYINVAYKERVFNWLEIYASYYTTSLLYGVLGSSPKDMPAFRQFNLGLNINFGRSYSYQY